MSSLLKVDDQSDVDQQEEDIKSVAATMYAGSFFPIRRSPTIYGLILKFPAGADSVSRKKKKDSPEMTISSRLSPHCVDNGGSGKLYFGFTQSSRGS